MYQQDVAEMQDKIYRMISGRLVPIAKECIVEKIGKRGERSIKTRFPYRPPIGVAKMSAIFSGVTSRMRGSRRSPLLSSTNPA
jgi:hypothetical protein